MPLVSLVLAVSCDPSSAGAAPRISMSMNFDDDPFSAPASSSSNSSSGLDDFDMSVPVQQAKPQASPFGGGFDAHVSPSQAAVPMFAAPPAEPVETPLSKWQAERRKQLQQRMAKAGEAKREDASHARNDLDKFYAERKEKIARNQQSNRADEAAFKEDMASVMASGSDWEKVAKLCDLSGKSANKANEHADRMRFVMIELKNEKPGAAKSTSSTSSSASNDFGF